MHQRFCWKEKNVIKWKRNDIGGVSSSDGRFAISPNFRSTVSPDSWELNDGVRRRTIKFCDKQRDAKETAETILMQEAEQIGAWGFERPDPEHNQHVIRWMYRSQR
jgi:hypothetical protein